jgi:hypothetical protein
MIRANALVVGSGQTNNNTASGISYDGIHFYKLGSTRFANKTSGLAEA